METQQTYVVESIVPVLLAASCTALLLLAIHNSLHHLSARWLGRIREQHTEKMSVRAMQNVQREQNKSRTASSDSGLSSYLALLAVRTFKSLSEWLMRVERELSEHTKHVLEPPPATLGKMCKHHARLRKKCALFD